MEISVQDKNKKKLATLKFDVENKPVFVGEYEDDFKKHLDDIIKIGITRLADIYNQKDKMSSIVEVSVRQEDNIFPLALKEFLGREGYDVEVLHPEVSLEILKLLESFPLGPDKNDLINRLPTMSYLEQTFLLEKLISFNKNNNL